MTNGVCAICGCFEGKRLLKMDCDCFDGSPLYREIRIIACESCGHVYNELTAKEQQGLADYYATEYLLTNVSAPAGSGDRPGSRSRFSVQRYGRLLTLVKKYVACSSSILDVGCAMGGFLEYMNGKGFSRLYGIDPVKEFIGYAPQGKGFDVRVGCAESIPYEDSQFDMVIMDQVLEHVIDPRSALCEARRVLKVGGYLCISVPDASRYEESDSFDYYWFLLKEHIHHFDLEHLRYLGKSMGLELIEYHRSLTPMMSEIMLLPNLTVIFRSTDGGAFTHGKDSNLFVLEEMIRKYISRETKKTERTKRMIEDILRSYDEIHVWGVGREFLYLYTHTCLKEAVKRLIDLNRYKRNNLTIGGKKIESPDVLEEVGDRCALIITAVFHKTSIKESLENMGYKGEIVEL